MTAKTSSLVAMLVLCLMSTMVAVDLGQKWKKSENSVKEASKTRRQEVAEKEAGYVLVNKEGLILQGGDLDKVLREDEVVEVRHAITGKKILTVLKASALPESELKRYDLEYTILELDRLSIMVDKHDEVEQEVRVKLDGSIQYPLIGTVSVKGLSLSQCSSLLAEKFKPFIKEPNVKVSIKEKSPRAQVLVIGKGFREYQGHERILDVLGAGYEPSYENIYDRVCVIRKKSEDDFMCIVVDMEFMFKYYDFSQNIPLKAGDIIHVKKMPPLLGYRFKWWFSQILGWMNEFDEAFNAHDSIRNFDFGNK